MGDKKKNSDPIKNLEVTGKTIEKSPNKNKIEKKDDSLKSSQKSDYSRENSMNSDHSDKRALSQSSATKSIKIGTATYQSNISTQNALNRVPCINSIY